ncbi:UdgX family uracil-DNA binding protein [Kaistia granuli]|uniref:UdgX family uracil-DNA binding protein n=1 Tax=Kaistia granuli TaxID=363259 RepID=UPI0003602E99|nr:UdgX family uracil-DNA binding protein [Kaistia granuli]
MHRVALAGPADFSGWRDAARRLARQGVDPADVAWMVDGEADLFGALDPPIATLPEGPAFAVPRGFLELAETAILHVDPERFALLYRMLCRLKTDHDALEDRVDPLVTRLGRLAKAVYRDIHKMHAFVRFRSVATEAGECFVAWFEPEHHIVEAAAPFFVRRFASMRWSILTPERCAHWDGSVLRFSDGVDRGAAPDEDKLEALWCDYYAAIFNPARLKPQAMRSEMPKKYWRNLPEASLIDSLIRSAATRSAEMVQHAPSAPNRSPQRGRAAPAPTAPAGSLEALRLEAADCRRCPLFADATQTVFGEGPADAAIVFVGEQPGDQEDLAGRPFVGPAGQVFDVALQEAGIDRGAVYVTNAVKHFKFVPRGRRRLHQKPNMGEIKACRWWLEQELVLLRPRLVVALGVTALTGLRGTAAPLASVRGQALTLADGTPLIATVHPSFLLRLPDEKEKAREAARFLEDLRRVAALAKAA